MMSITLNIAILNIKAAGYCCIIRGVIKGEVINLTQDIDLTEKKRKHKNLLKLNVRSSLEAVNLLRILM